MNYKKIYGSGASYPVGVTSITYASYLQITKYKYSAGLKAAYDNGQRDALASFGRASILQKSKDIVESLGSGLFGDPDQQDYNLEKLNADIMKDLKDGEDVKFTKEDRQSIKQGIEAGDYSHIFKDGNEITLRNGDVIKNPEQLEAIKKEARSAVGNESAVFNLPMPQEFSYNYSADWSNEFRMGTMARAMDELGKTLGSMIATGAAGTAKAIAEEGIRSFTGGIKEGAQGALDNVENVIASGFQGATNPLGSTDELNLNRVLGLAGLAPNENAINFFKKMSNRKFTFSFDMFARDEPEAKQIDEIIYAFKGGMHPSTTVKGTGGVLGFPDLFTIKPMFVEKNPEGGIRRVRHPMMPKSKMCALTDLTINTTPSNNFVTTKDGALPLQTITMMFEEITAMTQSDLKVGDF